MRILQSFWSRPSKSNNYQDDFGRYGGGWISEKYHAMSWALSCLNFKRFYEEVELYTDNDGSNWLIDKLGLPYTNVVKTLDQINNYNSSLWALAKTYTYLQQDSPFLHADSDVYIWQPFSRDFLNNRVFAQNIEYDRADNPIGIYINSIENLPAKLEYTPQFLTDIAESYQKKGRIEAINTGIIGGQDVGFLKSYARFVFDFLDKNNSVVFESSDMNLVEQLFLYCLAKDKDLPVQFLFEEEKAVSASAYASMIQFNLAPIVKKYIHLVGYGKKREDCCSQVALRLKYEYPLMYNHINSLYKGSVINYPRGGTVNPIMPGLEGSFHNTCLLLQQQGKKYNRTSYSSFITTVDKILSEAEGVDGDLLLGDIYEIEKFYYLWIDHYKVRKGDNGIADRLLGLLYNSEVSEFLNYKFTLNIPFIKTAFVNFAYPANFSVSDLTRMIPGLGEINNESHKDLVLLKMGDSDTIHVKPLSGWEILLAYFDGEEINGNELIELIRDGGIQEGKDIEDLAIFVLSFLTMNSLYFNYLRLV
jgi:hypothetical protein